MSRPRLIVLAAGEGLSLDGFNKALLRHPVSGETILARYVRLFPDHEVTVVVGYRAVAIMQDYPQLDYVYNADWRLTRSAYSLGLALDARPAIVISSDFFFDEALAKKIIDGPADAVVTVQNPSRSSNATNVHVEGDGQITAVYQGAVRRDVDPEAPGIFKISDPAVLAQWKRACLETGGVFALQNLPLDTPIRAIPIAREAFVEINQPLEYLSFLNAARAQSGE